jgi:5'-nucleotidase
MIAAMVNWDAIDHVLLDMDGTVLDLPFDNHFWGELVPARYAQARGIALDAARAELEPRFRDTQGRLQWYCLDHWCEVTGLDMAALKHEVRARIGPLPGALDFLRRVRAAGKPLWLVTNAHRASLDVKLTQTGLQDHFDLVLCAHDFGIPKEDSGFWPRLAQRHPFDPGRTLFVDDSLPVLRSAREYGIGHIVAIRKPDTNAPRRDVTEFAAVDALSDLAP